MVQRSVAQFVIAVNIVLMVLMPVMVPQEGKPKLTRNQGIDQEALVAPITKPRTDSHVPAEKWGKDSIEALGDSDRWVEDGGEDSDRWFVADDESRWEVEEMEMVKAALADSFDALETVGLDGEELLAGYRFRRQEGEFVRDERGLVALVNHDAEEIVLPDAAFLRQGGFSIFHELGHALDNRLSREMTRRFHQEAAERAGLTGSQSLTPDGFWLRPSAIEAREEATADAFALWVTVHFSGNRRPVFAGTPMDVQFEAIAQAIKEALTGVGGSGRQGSG